MPKRGSLFAREPVPAPEPKREEPLPAPRTSSRAPSREGKSAITFYVDPAAAKQLKRLCLDEDTSVQAVMVAALNALFAKRGLHRIGYREPITTRDYEHGRWRRLSRYPSSWPS